jgi:hypothetical protein
VAYHETFWVVIGTAAPVIALAGTVTFFQAPGALSDAGLVRGDAGRTAIHAAWLAFIASVACISLEVGALWAALSSIAARADAAGVTVIQYVTVGGFVLLLPAGAGLVLTQRWIGRWKERQRRAERELRA